MKIIVWISFIALVTFILFHPSYNYYPENNTQMTVVEHTLFGDYIAKDSVIHKNIKRAVIHKGKITSVKKKDDIITLKVNGFQPRYDVEITFDNRRKLKRDISSYVFDKISKREIILVQESFFPKHNIKLIYDY